MLVRELMTPNPITVNPSDSLGDAVTAMANHRIHELPVLEGGALVGIITERDVKMALGPDSRGMRIDSIDPRQLDGSVEWFMTVHATTVQASATVGDAVRQMLDLRVGALPVIDGGELVGILSVTDVLRVSLPLLDALD